MQRVIRLPEAPYNIAVVYQAQGRYDDATKVLQDLLDKTEKKDEVRL